MEKEGSFFFEVQTVRYVWIWFIVIAIAVFAWYGFVQQVILGVQFGSTPVSDWALGIIVVVFGIGIPALLVIARLEVEVAYGVLRIRYFPFHIRCREVMFGEIENAKAVTYRPLRDFGGWGIRPGQIGIAYTADGNRGVVVTLKNGGRFLIGSQRPDQLEMALTKG